MKSISILVSAVGLLLCGTLSASANEIPQEHLRVDTAAAFAMQLRNDMLRPVVRSRSSYDIYGLTAPVDRSFEVLEGDYIAWRSPKYRLA